MHIAIDYDDVICDFVGMVCDAVSRDFGVVPPVTKDNIQSWNFGQYLDQHIGENWWEWLEKKAYLWGEKAKPIPGALGGIEKLRRAGHRLELVTSKPEWGERYLWVWLGRYAPMVNQVTMIPLNANKTEWSDAQVLIDDRDKNVIEWVHSRPDREAFLYPAAHNQNFWPYDCDQLSMEEATRVSIVADWHDVVNRITEMEGAHATA